MSASASKQNEDTKKKKKSMNKAETVGLAGSLQAKQRVDGKSFSWLEFLVLSTSSHFGSS
jgi:hypothetical protein